MPVGLPCDVEVRRGECGRVVLGDAVLHHLHAGRPEPAVGVLRPPLDERLDLLLTSVAVPPQRADDMGGQLAAPRRQRIRRSRVVHARVVTDDRVLPAGDAEGVQVGLAGQQAAVVLHRRSVGCVPGDHDHRSLVQRASRLSVRPALEPPVRRVGSLAGDTGDLQGQRVHPGPVVVAVGQEHRAIGHDGVEVGRGRRTAGEGRHRPASTEDPGHVGVALGVRLDRWRGTPRGCLRPRGHTGCVPARPARRARGRPRNPGRAARRRRRRGPTRSAAPRRPPLRCVRPRTTTAPGVPR